MLTCVLLEFFIDHETRENKCLVMQTGDSLSREESPSASNRNDRVGCKSDEEAHGNTYQKLLVVRNHSS